MSVLRSVARVVPFVLVACNGGGVETTTTLSSVGETSDSGTTAVADTGTPGSETTSETTTPLPTSDGPTTGTSTGTGTTAQTSAPDTTTGVATTTTTSSTTTSTDTGDTGDTTATSDTGDGTSSTGDPGLCTNGEQQPCYSGDPQTEDVGLCKAGVSTCMDAVWQPCVGDVVPAAESCETPGDEDCDGDDPCVGDGVYAWHKVWGAGGDERGVRVAFDGAGALILAAQGSSTSDFGGGPLVSAGSWDLYLAKFAADGTHVWSKRYGDASAQFGDGWSLAVDADGGFVVAGGYQGKIDLGGGPLTSQSIADIFFARFTGAGVHVWSKSFKAGSYAMPESLAIDGDGEVYLTGYFTNSLDVGGGIMVSAGQKDAFVAKFTAAGAHAWSLRFGDPSEQLAQAIVVDAAGNATVGGYFAGTINPGTGPLVSAGGEDVFLAQFSPIGNAVWAKRFGDAQFQELFGLTRSPGGKLTAVGRFQGAVDFGGGVLVAAGPRGYAVQLAADGSHVWSKLLGSGATEPQSVATDELGNLVVTGSFTGMNDFGGGALVSEGGHDIFVARLGPAGGHVWSQRFGDNAEQEGVHAAATAAGVMAFTGSFRGAVNLGGGPANNQGGLDGFLAVFEP